ncbi:50S ribosomal protein L30 [Coxiella endosymbiont of Amblyomma sculptum]|uniref:50S ribosomal protein L30 n=1 Tax=Coxiella endosymbiont of Amblyomma sculptum TaxID=2487929 RepID=UPI00132EA504|nr:50S ribosomal protein L30 [Coxiella endosymbiont of Amblyomma sculptum]QHG92452.1 50S ribosomal protein L30 [Coxiella endosymbiont of Amblyomma sculptum]
MQQPKKIRVTLIGSKYGRKPGHRECIEGLGLRRMHQTVEIVNTSVNRGLINKVRYLLKITEV